MAALNFHARFAPLVESGKKKNTIRRTRRAKPGDILYLYTGQRTKACRKLGEGICTDVTEVTINRHWFVERRMDGVLTSFRDEAKHEIAVLEGFKDWPEMRDWFKAKYGLPFTGFMHFWRPKDGEIPKAIQ